MANRLTPLIGQWYTHRDNGQLFQVVAYDEHDGTIEIQEFDGDLDEFDVDTWRALPLDLAEPPEDWSGPVDDVEPDEFGYTDYQAEPALELETAGATTWQQMLEDDDLDELADGWLEREVTRDRANGTTRRDH